MKPQHPAFYPQPVLLEALGLVEHIVHVYRCALPHMQPSSHQATLVEFATFCEWAAEEGKAILLPDFRGTGRPRAPRPRPQPAPNRAAASAPPPADASDPFDGPSPFEDSPDSTEKEEPGPQQELLTDDGGGLDEVAPKASDGLGERIRARRAMTWPQVENPIVVERHSVRKRRP
ncbi:MAG: hypothetical protein BGP24_11160 [Lysobacterales bacterium 69-70]|nr:hypothetical protein [Xanthomonadaceae bacterium]ODU30787.1 MAG: hypothetical protein ABS97_20930 [Xanthomonadaceae bacterium SCN 69-320]ODV22114.1 MAG: hypothetical protein ABT27_02305 [Xanthomonadaceae bacterium SCN 69-25]OJY98375.1 MAG: hypothetical protein BGP24_11160 [Xanthomonadales bacterium 69-70]